ncbi:hypothetical protein HHK36_013137 [Tetracentron sinense]|uniref:S1 motif domain-containing protein n=1 Tax=Tetracentron sinense TaxID=13715 RepID=A0A834Z859_TETSI|nr:hypothetical protein HHK36_013137 [Tetracentron sinense]
MPMFTATVGSVSGLSFISQFFSSDASSNPSSISSSVFPSGSSKFTRKSAFKRPSYTVKASLFGVAKTEGFEQAEGISEDSLASVDAIRNARRSADWKAARAYKDSGSIYEGRIEGFNGGGLLVRFYSLVGFLPYPLLSPSYSCKEPNKAIQDIAKGLTGSPISVKVNMGLLSFTLLVNKDMRHTYRHTYGIDGGDDPLTNPLTTCLGAAWGYACRRDRMWGYACSHSYGDMMAFPFIIPLESPCRAHSHPEYHHQQFVFTLQTFKRVIQANEENRKLIFSEKDANWSKFSGQVKVGDIFEAMVGSVEDYGAFVHLRFPDGYYHITGLVHVSEVSWDLVQDVRDILNEGDEVRVKIIQIDREKSRVTLSIKQLEEDPLLETLDKVIPQDGQFGSETLSMPDNFNIEPLPGLETICKELMQEDGITDVRISRQGFEKRVVSQDLQLWLSNEPATDKHFTLLARAGRQVQEIHMTTTLDQEGIKKALQRVLERVP